MPIYELVCPECGHEENKLCSWKERQEATCSACGSKGLTHKYTSIGVIGSKSSSGCDNCPSRQSGFT